MDLLLFGRVIWRFKWAMALGLLMAIALAFLSFVRVEPTGRHLFQYRSSQQWASYSTLFVTENGFPWGSTGGRSGAGGATPPSASAGTGDPARFSSLAVIYAQLIPSDPVLQIMRRRGPIHGTIEAVALTDPNNTSDVLPLISVAGISDTPKSATHLVASATSAFLAYLNALQTANQIPPSDRVVVTVVNHPGRTKLLADRSKTLPIVIFLTVTMAAIAICFVLENLHPRVRVVTADPRSDVVPGAPSRTA